MDALNGASRGFLASVRTVRAFGAEEREASRFAAAAGELRSASVRAMRLTAAFMPLINLTANFGILALLYQARVQPGSGVGGLMASLSYMTQILFSLTMFSGLFDRAVRALEQRGFNIVLESADGDGEAGKKYSDTLLN